MRHSLQLLSLLLVVGCGDERITSTYSEPLPPGPGPLAVKFGMIFREGDICIDSATIRVVRGQGLDRMVMQQTPCDYYGGIGGWALYNLTPDGQPMTIRASASGYESRDTIVFPTLSPQAAVLLTLRKVPGAASASR